MRTKIASTRTCQNGTVKMRLLALRESGWSAFLLSPKLMSTNLGRACSCPVTLQPCGGAQGELTSKQHVALALLKWV